MDVLLYIKRDVFKDNVNLAIFMTGMIFLPFIFFMFIHMNIINIYQQVAFLEFMRAERMLFDESYAQLVFDDPFDTVASIVSALRVARVGIPILLIALSVLVITVRVRKKSRV